MNFQKLEIALELLEGIEPTAHMTATAQAYWTNAVAAIKEARADNSTKSQAAYEQAIEDAYFAGFSASGEGYNGEYGIDCPKENAIWKKDRDNELKAIKQALAAHVQPVGNWIWSWLMDWCKHNGIAPATRDSLFAMVSDARSKFESTPPAEQRTWVGLTAEQIASIPLNEHTLQKAERLLKDNNT